MAGAARVLSERRGSNGSGGGCSFDLTKQLLPHLSHAAGPPIAEFNACFFGRVAVLQCFQSAKVSIATPNIFFLPHETYNIRVYPFLNSSECPVGMQCRSPASHYLECGLVEQQNARQSWLRSCLPSNFHDKKSC